MQFKLNKKIAIFGLLLSAGTIFTVIAFFPPWTKAAVPYTHAAPEIIPGKIVTLKQLKEEHFIDFHNMFSIKVREPFESPKHITLNYTIHVLRYIMDLFKKGETLYYVIFDNKDNKLIGAIEIREKNDIDPGQLGCWINENYWGGGRIQEAYKLIATAYFKLKPNEESFEAQVREWNIRSYKALKKFGFIDMTILPDDKENKGARHVLNFYRKDLKP